MTDAMHDLVGHSIGTMAGTRAALEGVLDRFAPSELESKLVGDSVLDNIFPMKRHARLWNLYLQKFEAIRIEAKDDFDNLFGKAFVAAYEQQLDRLESEKLGASRAADA
jgi:FHA domain-containing protein